MITKREYAEEIAKRIEGTEVCEVEKANGVKQMGIRFNNCNVAPIIYIDKPYEEDMPIDEVTEIVREAGIANSGMSIDLDWINNYVRVSPKIKVRLYNKKTNAEVYVSARRYGFPDLILVPYVEDICEGGSAKVTNAMLDKWEVTAEEVIEQGIENLSYEIMSMSELLGIPMPGDPMKVVTNGKRFCGAASIIKAKDELANMFPNGYVVLPSSIHEVIVVPKDLGDVQFMIDMVREINGSVVAEEEVLGDTIYEF